jgi:hypothetical protein
MAFSYTSDARAELALRLHLLADAVASGDATLPAMDLVTDARDLHRLKVVPLVIHDLLCSARVATPQHTQPEVLACAFCGLAYEPPAREPAQDGPMTDAEQWVAVGNAPAAYDSLLRQHESAQRGV